MKSIAIVGLCALMFLSCRKEDQPFNETQVGTVNSNALYGIKTGNVSIGENYEYQAYFRFEENQNVGENLKFNWELGLSCSDGYVKMNNSISSLRIAKTELEWSASVEPDDLNFGWDMPSGQQEDLFVSDDFAYVFIMDRGVDAAGNSRGYKKFQVDFDGVIYLVRTAEINGSNEQIFEVEQNSTHSFRFLHLDNGIVDIAPPKTDWDLQFTHYLHIYDPETEPFPYQVTGCLLNPFNTRATEVTETQFDEIDWDVIQSLEYQSHLDVIGFDWKFYDFDLGFVVDDSRTFVVETSVGQFYKIKFTSFYNEEGEKGNPQFLMQRVKEN
jgi:hypothetical protein